MGEGKQARQAAPLLDIGSVIAAFSEEQVERITSLKKGRLRYWARIGFFKPSYVEDDRHVPYSRFYSFKDIVALRTLEMLRVQNNVTLQHLRKVADELSHLRDDLWTKTTLFVFNRKVIFVNPETGRPQEIVSGQYILGIPLEKVIDDTTADIVEFSRRHPRDLGRVSRDRSICHNAWVIAGTRIPIGAVRRLHEDGYSIEAIIEEFPDLTRADVEAALRHEAA